MATLQMDFFSTSLRRITEMSVILPVEKPNLHGMGKEDMDKPLKTLYLLHGYSGRNRDWLYGSRIEELAREFNVAVVMPSGENGFYLDEPIKGDYYEKLICEEIIELTRRAFPLSRLREDTVIGGLSMGGYGAMRNGLKRSDVFGAIFAFSSALITDEMAKLPEGQDTPMAPYSYYRHVFGDLSALKGSDKDPKALAKKLVDERQELPKIYMACGTEDFLLDRNRDFHRCLTELGVSHEYVESPGVHNWAFWDEYIEKAMLWLLGTPPYKMG